MNLRELKSPLEWLNTVKEAATDIAEQFADVRVRELPATVNHTFEAASVSPHDGPLELHLNLAVKKALRTPLPKCNPEVTVAISRKDTAVTATVTLHHI